MEIAISDNGTIAVVDGFHENTEKEQSLFISDDDGTNWSEVSMTNHPTMLSGILFLNNYKLIGWSKNTGAAILDLSPFLPVDLLAFNATCIEDKIVLKWSTSNEINLKNFEIQRRINNSNWETIATVEANNNHSVINEYEYFVTNSSSEIYYFRLKMNDINGSYEWSNLVSLKCNFSTEVSIFPNPTSSFVTIKGENMIFEAVDYQLFNVLGELIVSEKIKALTNEFQINLSDLPVGIYYMKIPSLNISQKIIVNKN